MQNREDYRLYINLLGSFKVRADGRDISGVRARTSLMWKLFKYLAVNRPRPVSTERLVDALWPDDECSDPLSALYTLVYRLRGVLESAVGKDCNMILFDSDSYSFCPDMCYIDADDFSCEFERSLLEDDEHAVPHLERALALYRGDLLSESSNESWLVPAASAVRIRFVTVASRLAGIYVASAKFGEAVRVCERALQIDPYEEDFHLSLLEALLGMGRVSLALAHFEYYTVALGSELGVHPSTRFDTIR
ncbi:MAG: BTAD domain-containing putative transcriptional regulator, partial [Oscillospiraceae bacterium]